MAETTTITLPKAVLKAARSFVELHGAPTRGVVEHIGRAGSRVVLVGPDGVLGDVLVAGPAAAEALIEQVGGIERAEWDAETTRLARIGRVHRHRMAGPKVIRWANRPAPLQRLLDL
jgi:hypothetical protein